MYSPPLKFFEYCHPETRLTSREASKTLWKEKSLKDRKNEFCQPWLKENFKFNFLAPERLLVDGSLK